MRRTGKQDSEGVIVELTPNGAFVKATAVDPTTGVEASVVGAASSPTSVLRNAAIRKLRYVMDKKKNSPNPRPGYLV